MHHTTVITWVKAVGNLLPDAYDPVTTPTVGELNELETFVHSKKLKSGARSVVDHFRRGILGWVLGDYSAKTFAPLWEVVATWECYFYCGIVRLGVLHRKNNLNETLHFL